MLPVNEDGTMTCRRMNRVRMIRRPINLMMALAVLPVLVAGCAAGSEGTVTPRAPASESGGSVSTELTIVSDDGTGKTETWTLSCGPDSGTHPDPKAACAALAAKGAKAMPPVAKDAICTQQYGGPQTAKITGTWQGEPVNASFSRTNGCEIGRWQSLKGLLPEAAGLPKASDRPQ